MFLLCSFTHEYTTDFWHEKKDEHLEKHAWRHLLNTISAKVGLDGVRRSKYFTDVKDRVEDGKLFTAKDILQFDTFPNHSLPEVDASWR